MHTRFRSAVRPCANSFLALTAALSLAACAGATVGSGVGDRMFERPPFRAGGTPPPGTPAHLAIVYQRGAADEPFFDPSGEPGSAVSALLAEMNTALDAMQHSRRMSPASTEPGRRPDVEFGCVEDFAGDCAIDGEPVSDDRYRMRLAVTRPSAEWTAWFAAELNRAGAGAGLLITLEVAQYWPRQRNLLGSKEIELGTDYAVDLPWLTALDRPIRVLQLTGAIVGADGRSIRTGAEGMLARRTNLLQGSLGFQALLTDEDVTELRQSRRDDLPGRPLVWEAALLNLVSGLTGSTTRTANPSAR